MRYLGGKQRIAKYIIDYLNQYSATHENLYETFCGASNTKGEIIIIILAFLIIGFLAWYLPA